MGVMLSLTQLGSHFSLLRYRQMIPMRQLSLAYGLHFHEHAPLPCLRQDEPMAKRFFDVIQGPSKTWPPVTLLTQPSLLYLLAIFY